MTVDPEEVIPPKRKAQIMELTMVPGRVISMAQGMTDKPLMRKRRAVNPVTKPRTRPA